MTLEVYREIVCFFLVETDHERPKKAQSSPVALLRLGFSLSSVATPNSLKLALAVRVSSHDSHSKQAVGLAW